MWVAHEVAYGQQLGHIIARFVGHIEVFIHRLEPLAAGAVHGAAHVAFAPVVGGQCERPVAEHIVQILQIV